jgi:hypothetical protein
MTLKAFMTNAPICLPLRSQAEIDGHPDANEIADARLQAAAEK